MPTVSSHYAVGLMSGTSLDGIDAALVKIENQNGNIEITPVQFSTYPYPKEIKNKLLKLCDPETSRLEDLSNMNFLLGELFSRAAIQVIEQAGFNKEDILLISSHGQTVYHQPSPVSFAGESITSTLQIGDIGVIAERTGIITVGDFRTRDMAAGGQGAPLVPYADYLLFKEKEFGRVLVNIGGISNITVLPQNPAPEDVVAFDTGPGNMIIDAFANWATNGALSYDKDGSLAVKGSIDQKWLNELLQHEYFKLAPPKSTGRELFGTEFAKRLWEQAEAKGLNHVDKIATITELTAITIVQGLLPYIEPGFIKEVLISGGGCFNHTLVKRIRFHLPKEVEINGTDVHGMPSDAKEAIVFALLGYQCYFKTPNNLPSATGAKRPVVMGKIAW
ncbi:MAG TPA: anhydro-N-acetylmuramic acid kinase [Bacillus sp. (in: firmicutes)]|uniref:anhydro-N-acetylmuramic acid kinase n=1 Tax=Bacillus litorisediminis TaxID=2922713 RepID=UPI001FABAFD0|nr:anhydro-N-acetylmuramic acid kinase [Bacillus litorisediminis]HWO75012.1 anhydro-N-acetylmuramic acid kinase [Bacillus sp. (in: firmicutes)]